MTAGSRAMRPRRRTAELAHVELEGELVLYDERDHTIHHLNRTASIVWQVCDGTATIKELALDFSEAFGQPAEDMERELRAVVRQMGDAGLMDVPKPRTQLPTMRVG